MTAGASVSAEAQPARKLYDLATSDHDYGGWRGAPRRTILVCTHPRSGSTLLGEALYFAGGLGCPLEYFHVGFRPTLAERWNAPDIASYAAAMTRYRTDPGGTVSMKLFWRDVVEVADELAPGQFAPLKNSQPDATSPETYRALAATLAPLFPTPQYIHLSRRDRVRQAISAVVASDTGLWRSIPGVGEHDPRADPDFDFDRIERMIAYSDFCHDHWHNFFAALGVTPLAVTYEELAADYNASVTRVLRYVGSDALPPKVRMLRQSEQRSEAIMLSYLRERAARTAPSADGMPRPPGA